MTHLRLTALTMLVATLSALSSCGQKGPLYLPQAGGEVITRPTQTPTATQSPTPDAPPASVPPTTDEEKTPPKPATPPPGVR